MDNNFQNQSVVPYAGGSTTVNWAQFNPFNPGGFGHQYQPALIAVGPKLTVLWQDQRLDHTIGTLVCPGPSASGHSIRDCTEHRVPMTTTTGGSDTAAAVFTPTINDSGLMVRHTVDAFAAQAIVSNNNPTFAATRVSQYPYGSAVTPVNGTRPRTTVRQLKFNVPNVPIFSMFTLPFDGDYNELAAQSIIATGNSAKPYAWNFDPNAVVHGTWTTNQDVIAPKDGNWANATPLMTLSGSTLTTNPNCVPGQEGSQNQNVYTATLFNGIEAHAVVNSKYLNSATPRQFNVVVRNETSQTLTNAVSMTILTPPTGTTASFQPSVSTSGGNLLSLTGLTLLPYSSLTRTVWAISSNPAATLTVNVVVASNTIPVLLNPDPAATLVTASQAADIVSNNQSQVTVVTTQLANAELTDNNLTDNNLTDNNLTDNNLTDAEITNNNLTDNNYADNNLTDNNLTDNNLTDNNLTDNNLTDNNLTDNNLTDNNLTDGAIADSTVAVFNNGNTDVSFSVKMLMRGQVIPPGYTPQVIVHKTYDTQTPDLTKRFTGGACGYAKTSQDVPVLNAKNPTVTSPDDPTLGSTNDTNPDTYTFSLLPQEIGRVVIRLVKNGGTLAQNQQDANEFGANGVKVVSVNASSTNISIPVVIDTLSLPEATAGSNYSTALMSTGGVPAVMWSLPGVTSASCAAYAGAIPGLPAGLTLSAAGVLSGTPATPGLYCFAVEVTDSSTPHQQTDFQLLTMIVHGTQTIGFPSGPFVYGGTAPLAATSSAGLTVTWSASGACAVAGNIVTITAGSGSCTLTATQPGNQIYLPLNVSSMPYPVSPAVLTITADNKTKSYGAALPALTASYSGFVNGDSPTSLTAAPTCSTTATASSPVANYPITCSGAKAANYTIGYGAGVLAVTQAPLTISPLPAFKVYGDPLPAFSLGYTGFVLNQGPAVLGGTPVFATPVTTSSVVGTYPVTVSGLTATNYAITFQPGVLTVTKATPVYSNLTSPVISSGATPTTLGGALSYAGLFPSGSVSITLNSVAQSAAIAGGAFSSSFATGALPSGSWTVTYSYPGDANFNPANATSTLKVSGSQATFQATGSLGTARSFHTATLLPSGKVLIAGGKDASGEALATAEVYDPSSGKFAPTANTMPNKAFGASATLLPTGKVLLAGGGNSSTQLYDPVTNTWSNSGRMAAQRSNHTATLLGNGKVLIAGGSGDEGETTNSAQLYDPSTGAFTSTGNMTVSRDFHTATLLPNGKVLIAGGRTGSRGRTGSSGGRTGSSESYTDVSSAEIYDPATGKFTATGSMSKSRYGHTAVIFNGKVLISGGSSNGGTSALPGAELYDPVTATFAVTGSMTAGRQYFTSTLVSGGVLATGGLNGSTVLASSDFYQGSGFTAGAALTSCVPQNASCTGRAAHTATLLQNGSVLIVGGLGSASKSIATAEIFGTPQ